MVVILHLLFLMLKMHPFLKKSVEIKVQISYYYVVWFYSSVNTAFLQVLGVTVWGEMVVLLAYFTLEGNVMYALMYVINKSL